MKSALYIPAVAAACMVTGCGGGRSTNPSRDGQTDSIAVKEEGPHTGKPGEEPLVALPDTAYESVSLIKWTTEVNDTVTDPRVDSYQDPYLAAPGVFAFRGNARRDGDMGGRVKGRPSEIVVDWKFKTEADNRTEGFGQQWGGGSGWTGQPVYVEWPDSMIQKFNRRGQLAPGFSGREIIVGSLASRLYFIDFETGEATRKPIEVFNPIKGSVMLDPTLNGNLYAGQGVPNVRPFGAITVDLTSHTVSDIYPEDRKAPRKWGAYDSNPVRAGQFVFRPGENGVIYKLNADGPTPEVHSTMSYKAGWAAPGIESSMSVYRNYGYTADNHGYVVCTNLDTMRPVWVYALGDDTDSTPVVAEEDGVPFLYIGSEIDRTSRGYARYVKLNALDGSVVWERELPGRRFEINGKHFDGGFYSSALLGRGNSSGLIFINHVENLDRQNGKFLALDRKSGETRYELPLKHYSWSSPVGYLNEEGEMYILTFDGIGNAYLIDAAKGEIIDSKPVGANFESSPVVAGNSAVAGSRGFYIYKVSLK